MKFNKDVSGTKYKDISEAFSADTTSMSQEEYRSAVINSKKKSSEDVGILKKCESIKEEDLISLSKDELKDACYPGNPKEASLDDVISMFRQLM